MCRLKCLKIVRSPRSGNTTKHDENMEHQSGKIKCSQLSSVSVIAQNKCSVVSAFLWEELKVIDETNS